MPAVERQQTTARKQSAVVKSKRMAAKAYAHSQIGTRVILELTRSASGAAKGVAAKEKAPLVRGAISAGGENRLAVAETANPNCNQARSEKSDRARLRHGGPWYPRACVYGQSARVVAVSGCSVRARFRHIRQALLDFAAL
jgi:hypothetical protein